MTRLLALVLLALAGCGGGPPDVVLVTVDTLRADHLGLYGHPQPTSPALDALAAESVVFDRAIATCPETAPSVASIVTGLHRARHGVTGNKQRLAKGVRTLAEIFKAHGYRTVGRVANPVLEKPTGFERGFDDYGPPPRLDRITPAMFEGTPLLADAERLLDAPHDAPLFLWLHLMDPHGPYAPPPAAMAAFREADYRRPGEPEVPRSEENYGLHLIPRYQAVVGERAPSAYRARYAGEIRHTDDLLARLIARLRARGTWDRTVFVLTADHGESLGEHDYYFQHGALAYEDSVRVPLLVRGPGLPAGRRVPSTVSLIDVAPTLLDLAGLPAEPAMEGRTLRPFLQGIADDRPAFSQTPSAHPIVALRRGPLSYVVTLAGDGTPAREELYDVTTDPGEARDLAAAQPDRVRALRNTLEAWRAIQGGAPQPAADGRAVDPERERQLRALGYLD